MRPWFAASIALVLALSPAPTRGGDAPPSSSDVAPARTSAPVSPMSGVEAASAVEAMLTGPGAADVAAVERAFAKTMADRDLEAFAAFLHPDTVWFSGPGGSALHGRDAVVAAWSTFYEGPDAPFAWAPDRVAVTDDGKHAMSMGPVFSPDGAEIARFTSVWQRDENGRWLILFDKGEAAAARD